MQGLRKWLLILAAGAALAGCADGKPMAVPQSGEIPEGPGLFSGDDGVFTIYRNGKSRDQDELPSLAAE